ncbi:MAG: hypothetical protein SGBAC_004365 [Bacillariaceae sp.]
MTPNETFSLGIQRFHLRVVADHPYTRRSLIVSNIVKGGKCVFERDFPTGQQLPAIKNETKGTAESQNQEQKIQDVILLQGSIYSKTNLLQYSGTRNAINRYGRRFANPTKNGRTFTLGDIDSAPCSLTGKELQEYAMCCTGEDADAIFRHEIKIILANDIGITLEDDKSYTLFWYVSKLQEASIRCVGDAEAAFTNHLQKPDRKNQISTSIYYLFHHASYFLIQSLALLLPALLSKLVLRDLSSNHQKAKEEAREDASAAKEELMSKTKELKRSKEVIQSLQCANGQNEKSISQLKETIQALERRQGELVNERDRYRTVVRQTQTITRIHETYMTSFTNFASEGERLQTDLESLRQQGYL